MVSGLINANPVIYEKKERRVRNAPSDADEYAVESIDQQEVFDILSKWLYIYIYIYICFLKCSFICVCMFPCLCSIRNV